MGARARTGPNASQRPASSTRRGCWGHRSTHSCPRRGSCHELVGIGLVARDNSDSGRSDHDRHGSGERRPAGPRRTESGIGHSDAVAATVDQLDLCPEIALHAHHLNNPRRRSFLYRGTRICRVRYTARSARTGSSRGRRGEPPHRRGCNHRHVRCRTSSISASASRGSVAGAGALAPGFSRSAGVIGAGGVRRASRRCCRRPARHRRRFRGRVHNGLFRRQYGHGRARSCAAGRGRI